MKTILWIQDVIVSSLKSKNDLGEVSKAEGVLERYNLFHPLHLR